MDKSLAPNGPGDSLAIVADKSIPALSRAMLSNLASLTVSHKAIAAKKHARRSQIKEVLFDDEARREFLTGFHKRKKAKADAARKKAQEREKQGHLDDRRERRQALREQAKENAALVERAYAAIALTGDEDEDEEFEEWHGVGSSSAIDKDAEYEDGEVVATVTVVEDFDPSTLTTAEPEPAQGTSEELPQPNPSSIPPSSHEKRPQKKQYKPKARSKKPRYEAKERGKKFKKAERASKASSDRKSKRR